MSYSEADLKLPALWVIDKNGGSITTSELIKELFDLLQPKGEDLDILQNRNDTKFSQKVRNLKCHRTLAKEGFVVHDDKVWKITKIGRKYLENNIVDM
ncbi:MAG: hypothetical protein OEZ01_08615 [Candidatus Heimdallarchaeota archaeon]|nr:hypothetical protein [Candidatus Heimdallarchaeota archaeon]MDH5646056.1 hypothetical protein [Candidatus Heimdallarchaeota archaeon]